MRSIVKNDLVKVISGNHKGKTGKVIMVIPEKNRVIVEKEASIHISNVMLVCPKCGKPTRTRTSTVQGNKTRVCGQCEEMISGE